MTNISAAGGNRFARWLVDDSFPPRLPDLAVYRYKAMIGIGPVLLAIALPTALSILATLPAAQVGGYVGLPIFGWVATSLVWLGTITSAVRVRPAALMIDNMVVRHVIPWERFAGLYVETGMGMFARLDDGATVRSSAFGRSLGDALKGYRHMRETLERIRADCRAARTAHTRISPEPPYEKLLNIPWRPLVGLLLFFEAFSWIAFAIHAG